MRDCAFHLPVRSGRRCYPASVRNIYQKRYCGHGRGCGDCCPGTAWRYHASIQVRRWPEGCGGRNLKAVRLWEGCIFFCSGMVWGSGICHPFLYHTGHAVSFLDLLEAQDEGGREADSGAFRLSGQNHGRAV